MTSFTGFRLTRGRAALPPRWLKTLSSPRLRQATSPGALFPRRDRLAHPGFFRCSAVAAHDARELAQIVHRTPTRNS
jgi:hypothetical protein